MNYMQEEALKHRLVQGLSLVGMITSVIWIGPMETLCILVWWGLMARNN